MYYNNNNYYYYLDIIRFLLEAVISSQITFRTARQQLPVSSDQLLLLTGQHTAVRKKWKVIKGNSTFQVGGSCRKTPCFLPWKKKKPAVKAKKSFVSAAFTATDSRRNVQRLLRCPGAPHICPMLHTFIDLMHVNHSVGHWRSAWPVECQAMIHKRRC